MGILAFALALAAIPTLQQQMEAVEARRNAAIWTGDRATLERIYAPDFHGLAAGGVRVDRAALLGVLARNAGGEYVAESEILSAREVNGLVFAEGRFPRAPAADQRQLLPPCLPPQQRRGLGDGGGRRRPGPGAAAAIMARSSGLADTHLASQQSAC